MNETSPIVLLLVGLATLGGCKKEQVEDPDLLPPVESATGPAPAESEDMSDESTAVRVDDRIAELCEIPRASFVFNSSKLGKPARKTLGALADCFTDGPARGESVQIVGHADPLGDEYDHALGQRRADAVAEYLGRAGLGGARVATTSRGELDAESLDDIGWEDDRRVDILLAGR